MSAQDRAIQKLARELAGIKKEVVSWRGPQADYTSIENGGNFTFKDSDGNVTAVVGGQDDGSNTIRHVDGPTPAVPSGLSAHVDGPIIQAAWDGTFETETTYDWAFLEVEATGPSGELVRATINDATGGSVAFTATASGEWTVVARSVSRAEKRSLDGDAGTVEVKITDLSGAIEAVQDSANGKNKVTYSSHAPTEADPGIFDDTWFVGQVGRPNDVVEATNLAQNPSMETLRYQRGDGDMFASSGTALIVSADWSVSGGTALEVRPSGSTQYTAAFVSKADDVSTAVDAGKTFTVSANFHLDSVQTGTLSPDARMIEIRTRVGSVTSNRFARAGAPNVVGDSRVSVTFTLPSDLYSWHIVLWNGSQNQSAFWDSLLIEEGSTASPYFDGDTTSGTTDDEPHYRWTGTPHASSSQKYLPAIPDSGSDAWNITEQWQFTSAGWKPVEVSHQVIATVDLGKATVGELDGIRIMGQSIRGAQLSGDAIDGKVITGPIIQSAREGQRWVGDTTGIRIFNADNEVRTQLSPDDSVFKGEVEADTLVVNDGAEFKANNTLAQGASLLLAAGVTDPTAPPTVQPFWDGLEFDNPAGVTRKVGLAFDGTNYWTANPDGISSGFNFVRISATTGASTTFSSPIGAVGGEWFGVTCIGTELFWFYRKRYQAFVLVTDLNCVQKREWEYPNLGHTSSNPLTYKPGIGNDGTNIVIAQCDDAGPLNIRTYNKTTGALISAVKDTGDGTKSDITGVHVGNADWGRKLVTVAKQSGGKLPSFSATTGVYDGGATQFNAATSDSTGVVFVDGKFRTLDPSGMIHEYADVTTGDNSSDWWAAYRWYTDVNDDDIIGSTDYTSRISPGARFTWTSRAMVRVIGQPLPDGAESLGPYLAKKSTVPVRTDYHAPSWWPTAGRPVAEWRELSTDWGTKPVPGDTNTYPEGTSSVLESASGTFRVQGDGSGHWGPLTMGRNGVMSGLIVSGTLLITPDQADVSKEVEVMLPAGRFSTPPIVWAQASSTVPERIDLSTLWESVTVSSFKLYLTRTNTTTTGVRWFAMDGG